MTISVSRFRHYTLALTVCAALLVITLAVIYGRHLQRPLTASHDIPMPFGSRTSSLRGNLMNLGTTEEELTIVDTTFDDGEEKEAFPQKAFVFALMPTDASSFSAGASLDSAFTAGKHFYGYKYYSPDGKREREMQALIDNPPLNADGNPTPYTFPERFPGTFFASDADLSDSSSVPSLFHSQHEDITFLPLSALKLDAGALYLIVTEDEGITMTVRGLPQCGQPTLGSCSTGNVCRGCTCRPIDACTNRSFTVAMLPAFTTIGALDLDRDGDRDIVGTSIGSSVFVVPTNGAARTFAPAQRASRIAPQNTGYQHEYDFNGDGKGDILLRGMRIEGGDFLLPDLGICMQVAARQGECPLTCKRYEVGMWENWVTAGDVDSGPLDVVLSTRLSANGFDKAAYFDPAAYDSTPHPPSDFSDKTHTFTMIMPGETTPTSFVAHAVGNRLLDGRDLVFLGDDLKTIFAGRNGGEARVLSDTVRISDRMPMLIADVDGDGKDDIIAQGMDLEIRWLSAVTGTWHSVGSTPAEHSPYSGGTVNYLDVADMNEDGRPDIVIASWIARDPSPLFVVAWMEQGVDGTWIPHIVDHGVSMVLMPSGIHVADVDGDGHPDILVAGTPQSRVYFQTCGGVSTDVCGSAPALFCDLPPLPCGDGHIVPPEECDDGEDVNGLLCTAGYGETCHYCSSTCTNETITGPHCGDSKIDASHETCDDGNADGGDGCSATCSVENGYTCTGTPSVCTQVPQWRKCEAQDAYCSKIQSADAPTGCRGIGIDCPSGKPELVADDWCGVDTENCRGSCVICVPDASSSSPASESCKTPTCSTSGLGTTQSGQACPAMALAPCDGQMQYAGSCVSTTFPSCGGSAFCCITAQDIGNGITSCCPPTTDSSMWSSEPSSSSAPSTSPSTSSSGNQGETSQ